MIVFSKRQSEEAATIIPVLPDAIIERVMTVPDLPFGISDLQDRAAWIAQLSKIRQIGRRSAAIRLWSLSTPLERVLRATEAIPCVCDRIPARDGVRFPARRSTLIDRNEVALLWGLAAIVGFCRDACARHWEIDLEMVRS